MTPITDDLLGHTGLAGVIVGAIEWLKRSKLPGTRWISEANPKAAIYISAAAAFLTSLGFQAAWNGVNPWEMFMGQGGTITLTIPPDLPDVLLRAVGQMVLNMGAYHGVLKPAVNH
jgi:hypothetical protein